MVAGAARMRWLGFGSLVLAACGTPHSIPTPDSSAVARCTETPTRIASTAELAPPELGSIGLVLPHLACDDTGVYYNLHYLPANGQPPATGHIGHVPFGGTPTNLVDAANPTLLALDGDDIVYAEDAGLRRVPRAGGSASDIAAITGSANWLSANGAQLYVGDDNGIERIMLPAGQATAIASTVTYSGGFVNGDVVVADFTGGTVTRVSGSSFAATTLATGQLGPIYPIACGTDAVCWLDAGDAIHPGTLMRVTTGNQPAIVAQDKALYHPHGLAFDGTSFFVSSDNLGGTVSRVDAQTGKVDVLVPPHGDGDVVTDDRCVYYSTLDGIFSLAKDAPAVMF
jgi:hypothetical protein